VRDKPEIERKLRLLAEYLAELEQLSQATYTQYKSNFQIKRAAERLIQLAIEAATLPKCLRRLLPYAIASFTNTTLLTTNWSLPVSSQSWKNLHNTLI
jgi:hypothetical protein